ncbi:MAG: GNAT family N-acetyltransferase [Lapillicoccus sp.]
MSPPHDHAHDHGHDQAHNPAPDHPVADASVRVATPWDVDAVGAVQADVWRAAYASLLPAEALAAAAPAEFARVWRDSLAKPPSGAYRLLVACAGDEVVGFAAIGPSADPDATDVDGELLVGGVSPSARRTGHGSRLLNAAVDTARLTGFARVRTWLLGSDAPTRGFLEAAGFAADGARRERVTGPAEGDVTGEVRLIADVPQ